jgi:hypothetical protein
MEIHGHGIEGRRGPASSHDNASQKPDTDSTPCIDKMGHRLQRPALPVSMTHWRWDVEDGGSVAQWQREEMNSLY